MKLDMILAVRSVTEAAGFDRCRLHAAVRTGSDY